MANGGECEGKKFLELTIFIKLSHINDYRNGPLAPSYSGLLSESHDWLYIEAQATLGRSVHACNSHGEDVERLSAL